MRGWITRQDSDLSPVDSPMAFVESLCGNQIGYKGGIGQGRLDFLFYALLVALDYKDVIGAVFFIVSAVLVCE